MQKVHMTALPLESSEGVLLTVRRVNTLVVRCDSDPSGYLTLTAGDSVRVTPEYAETLRNEHGVYDQVSGTFHPDLFLEGEDATPTDAAATIRSQADEIAALRKQLAEANANAKEVAAESKPEQAAEGSEAVADDSGEASEGGRSSRGRNR